jgi:hypothetical protein
MAKAPERRVQPSVPAQAARSRRLASSASSASRRVPPAVSTLRLVPRSQMICWLSVRTSLPSVFGPAALSALAQRRARGMASKRGRPLQRGRPSTFLRQNSTDTVWRPHLRHAGLAPTRELAHEERGVPRRLAAKKRWRRHAQHTLGHLLCLRSAQPGRRFPAFRASRRGAAERVRAVQGWLVAVSSGEQR